MSSSPFGWISQDAEEDYSSSMKSKEQVWCICLGTGRFLRSVLIPSFSSIPPPILIQPRGTSFLEYMKSREEHSSSFYEVDTIEQDGTTTTIQVPCGAALSFGSDQAKLYAFETMSNLLLPSTTNLPSRIIIGVGVTEAGLSNANTSAMKHLKDLLEWIQDEIKDDVPISIINTDNVPMNGNKIHYHMKQLFENDDTMLQNVTFHNSMVDRIVSHREDNNMIPKCEPIPSKALVLLDEKGVLSSNDDIFDKNKGVIIRTSQQQLEQDISLKLRIANGTHTALAHPMALSGVLLTSALSKDDDEHCKLWNLYLESLVSSFILKACNDNMEGEEAILVWQDWKRRLLHPYFGLSTFFITQNGPAKGGIRWGPTMKDVMMKSEGTSPQPTVAIVFAYASLLRWLAPVVDTKPSNNDNNVFYGWLDGKDRSEIVEKLEEKDDNETITYADGLNYNLKQGWYTFKCDCFLKDNNGTINLAVALGNVLSAGIARQPSAYVDIVRRYLLNPNGGNLGGIRPSILVDELSCNISTILARMIAGDSIPNMLLEEYSTLWTKPMSTILMDTPNILRHSSTTPLHYKQHVPIPSSSKLLIYPIKSIEEMESIVMSEISTTKVVDVHTHLFPPQHGPTLFLYGIDELLTYHYLISEFFMTCAASTTTTTDDDNGTIMTPSYFFNHLNKIQQADLIWKSLFINRLPTSEACRGVLTVLHKLNNIPRDVLRRKDLQAIRAYYKEHYQSHGIKGATQFSHEIFEQHAGIQYVVMTNIPFDPTEAAQWNKKKNEDDTNDDSGDSNSHYKSALRVDPLLMGDVQTVNTALKMNGYETTLIGAKQYLHDWCDLIKPEYMMASTPHDFVLKKSAWGSGTETTSGASLNPNAFMEPGAFATAAASSSCPPGEEDMSSMIDENCDLFTQVLMPVCQERNLALALKIGAHRGVNSELQSAGDGVASEVDLQILARLCNRYPKVKFLATVLSLPSQQEACVLASKFSNLHLYGCWWFCNTPSMIESITTMRCELLGLTSYTAQHSDARVLDQLIYKWAHSRAILAKVLTKEFGKLLDYNSESGGWQVTREEVRRDIQRLLGGGSYHEFMKKKL